MNAAQSLVFQNTQFDVVDQNGQPWLKAADLARALGYAAEDAVSRIYRRNADEFTAAMSQTVKLTVSGKINDLQHVTVRIFSLRGAHLLAMFARTPVAKAFRKWVLDVLDMVTGQQVTVHGSTIGTDGLNCLAAVIDGKVRHLPAPARRSAKMHIWQQVHKAFSVVRAEQIPVDKLDAARNFVAAHTIEGEWMPAQKEITAKQSGYLLSDDEAATLSGVFGMIDMMRETLKELEKPMRDLKSPLAPRVYDGWHEIGLYLLGTDKLRAYSRQVYLAMERRVLGASALTK